MEIGRVSESLDFAPSDSSLLLSLSLRPGPVWPSGAGHSGWLRRRLAAAAAISLPVHDDRASEAPGTRQTPVRRGRIQHAGSTAAGGTARSQYDAGSES
jgi:hypothetical protein